MHVFLVVCYTVIMETKGGDEPNPSCEAPRRPPTPREHGILSRAEALDPAQAEVLRGELDRLHGEGGETEGGSGGTPGGADVVGEIADILEDLHEQRDEQGEQRRRVPGACESVGAGQLSQPCCVLASCTPGGGHGVLCHWASLPPVPTGSSGGGARVRASVWYRHDEKAHRSFRPNRDAVITVT